MDTLELLEDPDARRFLFEALLVGILVAAVVSTLVAPALQSAFPDLFAAGSDGFGKYDLPETRLEWTLALLGTGLLGAYVYWRLFFTALGDRTRATLEAERYER